MYVSGIKDIVKNVAVREAARRAGDVLEVKHRINLPCPGMSKPGGGFSAV